MEHKRAAIVGGGLAGCECALRLAAEGVPVTLFEQKPLFRSPAHADDRLAELVCSNSLRSNEPTSGVGLLKEEMRALGSVFMACADANAVPAGKALAVDRTAFAAEMTRRVEACPGIRLERRRICGLDDPALEGFEQVIIAAGPLASDDLAASLAAATGADHCFFYDAIAPIVWTRSLDMDIVFRASRYGQEKGEIGGDYLNCPMSREEYDIFHRALLEAEQAPARHGEELAHFEGCMPVEALAERGPKTLVFGPFKPVGFVDPRTGRRPWAVVQLRAESANGEACNLVGCQTRLKQGEQERVFRLIPGMGRAEFVRFGSMHRNTYVNAPEVLDADLRLRAAPRFLLAGQITGVEGYVESAACGLWLGMSLAARLRGRDLPHPPPESALGALLGHLRTPAKRFQPSNAHFGLTPPLDERARKRDRKAIYAERGRAAFAAWIAGLAAPAPEDVRAPAREDAMSTTSAEDIAAAKKDFRKRIRALRRDLPPERRGYDSLFAQGRILALPEWRNARSAALYVSLPEEMSSDALLDDAWAAGREVWLPRVVPDRPRVMEFVRCAGREDLVPGHYGIMEPRADLPGCLPGDPAFAPDFVLVPGVAFDRRGVRLGFGGGYYDTFLERAAGATRAAICHAFQVADSVPADAWDQRVSVICTEEETLWIR